MAGVVHVVRALVRPREPGDAARLAQGVELGATARDELVRVSLVPHVEHETVLGGVDERMHGQDNLDGPERRCHMAARLRRGGHDLLAYFMCEDAQLLVG